MASHESHSNPSTPSPIPTTPNSSPQQGILAQGWAKAGVLLVAGSLTVMAGAAMAPTIHPIMDAFAHEQDIDFWSRMVLALPALGIIFAAPIAGRVIDKVGRRPVLLTSLIIYGVCGCSGFFATELWQILVGRLIFGVGVAGVMSAATTLIGDYYSGQARARFMGYQSAFMALGGILSPKIAGELAVYSWNWPFLVYSVAFVVFAAALFVVNEPRKIIALKSASGRFLPSEEDESSTRDAWRIAAVTCAAIFIGMLTFYSVPLYLGDLLIGMGYTEPSAVGTAIMFMSMWGAGLSLIYGKIRARLSFVSISALLYASVAGGFLVLSMPGPLWQLALGMTLVGLGAGIQMPNLTSWLLSRAPGRIRGTLSGAFTFSLFFGQFVSMFLFQPIYRAATDGLSAADHPQSVGAASVFFICSLIVAAMALGFFATTMLRRSKQVEIS